MVAFRWRSLEMMAVSKSLSTARSECLMMKDYIIFHPLSVRFPSSTSNAFGDRLPDNIVQQGGVFLPMWQREALWISFTSPTTKKYALRVFVGRINAVSGVEMDDRADEAQGTETLQDYVVVPGQEWLDGICVAPGIVRQFVAMPCK
jgi:hypothetical protein